MDVDKFMDRTEGWLKGENNFLDRWQENVYRPIVGGQRPTIEALRQMNFGRPTRRRK